MNAGFTSFPHFWQFGFVDVIVPSSQYGQRPTLAADTKSGRGLSFLRISIVTWDCRNTAGRVLIVVSLLSRPCSPTRLQYVFGGHAGSNSISSNSVAAENVQEHSISKTVTRSVTLRVIGASASASESDLLCDAYAAITLRANSFCPGRPGIGDRHRHQGGL